MTTFVLVTAFAATALVSLFLGILIGIVISAISDDRQSVAREQQEQRLQDVRDVLGSELNLYRNAFDRVVRVLKAHGLEHLARVDA